MTLAIIASGNMAFVWFKYEENVYLEDIMVSF